MTISVIDVARLRVIQSIQVGELPWGDRLRSELKPHNTRCAAPSGANAQRLPHAPGVAQIKSFASLLPG